MSTQWGGRGQAFVLRHRLARQYDFRAMKLTPCALRGLASRQQLGSTSAHRGMTGTPTFEIRPGCPFTAMVTHDLIFRGPYTELGWE